MERVRNRSEGAAQELIDRYGPAVLTVVRRKLHKSLRSKFDSMDFVQSVWASFFAIPAQKYAFDDPESLIVFLSRVARHKVVDVVRQRLRTQKYDVRREVRLQTEANPHGSYIAGRAPTASEIAIAQEEWERISTRQPVDLQAALQLRREGGTVKEVADCLGISERMLRRIFDRL